MHLHRAAKKHTQELCELFVDTLVGHEGPKKLALLNSDPICSWLLVLFDLFYRAALFRQTTSGLTLTTTMVLISASPARVVSRHTKQSWARSERVPTKRSNQLLRTSSWVPVGSSRTAGNNMRNNKRHYCIIVRDTHLCGPLQKVLDLHTHENTQRDTQTHTHVFTHHSRLLWCFVYGKGLGYWVGGSECIFSCFLFLSFF